LALLKIKDREMADVKVKVKIVWAGKDKSTFKVIAKTLGAAAKELDKRDEWGKFRGKVGFDYQSDENDYVTEVTLKPSYTIEMPVWANYKKAPKACQEEWDRMWKKLEEHEDGHRVIHLETLTTMQNTLGGQTNLPADQLKTDFAQMENDGQDNQDKFDTATDHGAKKGVELTITDECK
jgi:predicted secreted Zn-dependent protease